jgi:hypothetical protein
VTPFSSVKHSWRLQLTLIGLGYALVLTSWGGAVFMRELYEKAHPEDLNASGGMYAFSAAITDIFHACLLMVPTGF